MRINEGVTFKTFEPLGESCNIHPKQQLIDWFFSIGCSGVSDVCGGIDIPLPHTFKQTFLFSAVLGWQKN